MTCREIERLFVEDAPEAQRQAHVAGCAGCRALAAAADEGEDLASGLQPAAWSGRLRDALFSIPELTVRCDAAADLIAAAAESPAELPERDRSRLAFHLTRCEGCREASAVVGLARELEAPQTAPWLATRIAAGRPKRARTGWRGLLDPRAAIAFAYAAALIVMLAGFNPADLARRAGAGLRSETKSAATVASNSLADRVGAFQDRAVRTFAVWRGRAGGYGRAVLSNAIALVMRTEESRRPPSRPRNGEEHPVPRSETNITTWRA
ncbi:MAG: hypothetical protein ABI592_07625 [Acidobacteriota bacterium]